jgi:hypothetical protein
MYEVGDKMQDFRELHTSYFLHHAIILLYIE